MPLPYWPRGHLALHSRQNNEPSQRQSRELGEFTKRNKRNNEDDEYEGAQQRRSHSGNDAHQPNRHNHSQYKGEHHQSTDSRNRTQLTDSQKGNKGQHEGRADEKAQKQPSQSEIKGRQTEPHNRQDHRASSSLDGPQSYRQQRHLDNGQGRASQQLNTPAARPHRTLPPRPYLTPKPRCHLQRTDQQKDTEMLDYNDGDELDMVAEEPVFPVPDVQAGARDDEILEDAPAAQFDASPASSSSPEDHTMQSWLQEHQDPSSRRANNSWTQTRHALLATTSANWAQGQQRLLAEQTTALTLQAKKLQILLHPRSPPPIIPSHRYITEEDPLAEHSQNPFVLHQRLYTIIQATTTLRKSLNPTAALVTLYETRLAQRENRPPRHADIDVFFGALHDALVFAAQRLEVCCAEYRLDGAWERGFCAAWEEVLRAYCREVVRFEEESGVPGGGVGEGWGAGEWEGYVRVLGGFAERVKGLSGCFGWRGGEMGMKLGVE